MDLSPSSFQSREADRMLDGLHPRHQGRFAWCCPAQKQSHLAPHSASEIGPSPTGFEQAGRSKWHAATRPPRPSRRRSVAVKDLLVLIKENDWN
jgi:hypothetical protein